MTMNLKKVFTSTSFNLSSVFYARFCAGSFYQEFDGSRTFLLYKKESCLQDSPPAAGRFSDIIPLRRSAILPEGLFYVIGTLRSNFL